jgi:radical SAM protein with 4Fe4S-binding SPASM domain
MSLPGRVTQNIAKALRRKKGLALHRLHIDVVHGCQLRCIGCPNSTLNPKIAFMPPDDFDLIMGNIDVTYIKRLRLFNFGEPLLYPHLAEVLLKIPKQRFKVRTVEISTNAQHHDFPLLAEAFKSGVLDLLAISCDGDGTAEEYERLRPPGKFSRLLEFMEKAKELRDRYAPGLVLVTRTICDSAEGRKRWSDLLAPLGWKPEFREWFTLPQSIKQKTDQQQPVEANGCSFMRDGYLYVDYDGTVVPCCMHPKAFELGNLKVSKYSEILGSETRTLMIHSLNTDKKHMAVCGMCEY